MNENTSLEPQIQPTTTPEPKNPPAGGPKYLILILIIAGIAISGYFVAAKMQDWWPLKISDKKKETSGQICIQVITPARNPKTGEVRDFPTPCDVPEGWEKLEFSPAGPFIE